MILLIQTEPVSDFLGLHFLKIQHYYCFYRLKMEQTSYYFGYLLYHVYQSYIKEDSTLWTLIWTCIIMKIPLKNIQVMGTSLQVHDLHCVGIISPAYHVCCIRLDLRHNTYRRKSCIRFVLYLKYGLRHSPG